MQKLDQAVDVIEALGDGGACHTPAVDHFQVARHLGRLGVGALDHLSLVDDDSPPREPCQWRREDWVLAAVVSARADLANLKVDVLPEDVVVGEHDVGGCQVCRRDDHACSVHASVRHAAGSGGGHA